jgi:2-polyprenyl-6-methoxyphenol hydroxylase-like FAD-dependent oxidoreductase
MVQVAIVGGGIGGLAAALALESVGVEVGVYEQAAHLGEVGAGVGLQPNSMRVLQRLGVAEEVARQAAPIDEAWFRHPDGSLAGHDNVGEKGPQMGMYRPDLVATLAAALPDGVLHTGRRCTGFSQDEGSATLTFDDGASVQADVVIGADGIHSMLQGYVVEPQPPVFSGIVAYRGVVPSTQLPDWPRRDMVMWTGQGKHFLTFAVHGGELRNYVGFVPTDEQMRESWSAPGDPAVLAAEFAGWDPTLGALLAEVQTTFRWGLYDRDPLPRWTHGRLTLLGDAAHAMLPHMGQGANQSIEDGMALATLIQGVDTAEVPGALLRYEKLRREHTAAIQQGSRANGLRLDSGQMIQVVQPGMQDYDVEAEAVAARR